MLKIRRSGGGNFPRNLNTFFIMARISHTNNNESTTSNPTTKYLEWKSNEKNFRYYDKSASENVDVNLPFKFLFLQHYHTVKGWNDASASGIYSNEVFYIGSEEMTVRSFKGGVIAEGIYKDIKPKIINAGGKYHRSVYVMLEDGTIANLSFKGAVVKEWSDFIELNKKLVDNKWIEITEAKEEKKGSVNYTVPTFVLGANISKADATKADVVADELKDFLDRKSTAYANKPILVSTVEVDDDLGF